MENKIKNILRDLEPSIINFRRTLHHHAESGWTEFWTASFIAEILDKAGYGLKIGRDVIEESARTGVPTSEELVQAAERALGQGANPKYVELMRGGFTGVVADLHPALSPRIALRFDIDANTLTECQQSKHRPFAQGFASVNKGTCHACGHDGNTAIGLGVALILAELRDEIDYNVRLIFQPAEEGVRGALPMVKAGVVDGIKAFVSCHIAFKALQTGELILGASEFLATSKFDVTFRGKSSHAGAHPEAGNNSLLAAATACLNLHAIPRHSAGATRITVGRLEAGEGRNIIPGQAKLCVETRGQTTELNEFMLEKSKQIIEHSACMYDQDYEFELVGGCKGGQSSPEMISILAQAASKIPFFMPQLIRREVEFGGSDDVTEFMTEIQKHGGIASYAMIGTEISAGHHNYCFDFNEQVLAPAVAFLVHAIIISAKQLNIS